MTISTEPKPILTAQWRNLVMLNYEVDPDLLRPHVPAGTELDRWNGRTFVSIVGFRFLEARWFGWRIPFNTDFDEVNLRFYVRRKTGEEWRRGVVFLKEIAPRPAVAFVARTIYNEQYITLPVRSSIELPSAANAGNGSVGYSWKWQGQWIEASANIQGDAMPPRPGSEAEFITEHYWAYTAQRNGTTLEHHVEHPTWKIWDARSSRLQGDFRTLYGPGFASVLKSPPSSAIVADGSPVKVRRGDSYLTPTKLQERDSSERRDRHSAASPIPCEPPRSAAGQTDRRECLARK